MKQLVRWSWRLATCRWLEDGDHVGVSSRHTGEKQKEKATQKNNNKKKQKLKMWAWKRGSAASLVEKAMHVCLSGPRVRRRQEMPNGLLGEGGLVSARPGTLGLLWDCLGPIDLSCWSKKK